MARRRACPHQRTRIVDWFMDCKINIDDPITHTLPLAYINKGFDLMHAEESIRRVVVFWLTRARRDARSGSDQAKQN